MDLNQWRNKVASKNGPPDATTRLTLLCIALHMKKDGTSAFPSQQYLAERAGLTERTVQKHIQRAVEQGWLKRRKRSRGRWPHYEYEIAVPSHILVSEKDSTIPESSSKPPEPSSAHTGNSRQKHRNQIPTNYPVTNQLTNPITKGMSDEESMEGLEHTKRLKEILVKKEELPDLPRRVYHKR